MKSTSRLVVKRPLPMALRHLPVSGVFWIKPWSKLPIQGAPRLIMVAT